MTVNMSEILFRRIEIINYASFVLLHGTSTSIKINVMNNACIVHHPYWISLVYVQVKMPLSMFVMHILDTFKEWIQTDKGGGTIISFGRSAFTHIFLSYYIYCNQVKRCERKRVSTSQWYERMRVSTSKGCERMRVSTSQWHEQMPMSTSLSFTLLCQTIKM